MPSPLQLKLLGYPQVWYLQTRLPLPAPKILALLAYLALHPEGIDREDLAGLLWEQGKAQNVRQALYHLRSVPGSDVWLSAGAVVRADVLTDVAQVENALSSGDTQGALSLWSSEQDATLLAIWMWRVRQTSPNGCRLNESGSTAFTCTRFRNTSATAKRWVRGKPPSQRRGNWFVSSH